MLCIIRPRRCAFNNCCRSVCLLHSVRNVYKNYSLLCVIWRSVYSMMLTYTLQYILHTADGRQLHPLQMNLTTLAFATLLWSPLMWNIIVQVGTMFSISATQFASVYIFISHLISSRRICRSSSVRRLYKLAAWSPRNIGTRMPTTADGSRYF